MKAIKLILGGIGILVFSICCFLLANLAGWNFMTIPCLISLAAGFILVIAGLFTKDDSGH